MKNELVQPTFEYFSCSLLPKKFTRQGILPSPILLMWTIFKNLQFGYFGWALNKCRLLEAFFPPSCGFCWATRQHFLQLLWIISAVNLTSRHNAASGHKINWGNKKYAGEKLSTVTHLKSSWQLSDVFGHNEAFHFSKGSQFIICKSS